jgi:predicted MFS family arabinose efflux permease
VGLSVAQVGVGLTIAGLCGVLAGMPFRHLADRRGARRLLVVLLVLEGLATLAFVAVDSSRPSCWCASAAAVLRPRRLDRPQRRSSRSRMPEGERVRGRALLRSLTNVGIGCGTAVAALALHYDSRPAYVTLIVADVCAFMVAAALLTRLPRATADATAPRVEGGPRLLALRDRPYLAVTALFAVVSFQFGSSRSGLPIWGRRAHVRRRGPWWPPRCWSTRC